MDRPALLGADRTLLVDRVTERITAADSGGLAARCGKKEPTLADRFGSLTDP